MFILTFTFWRNTERVAVRKVSGTRQFLHCSQDQRTKYKTDRQTKQCCSNNESVISGYTTGLFLKHSCVNSIVCKISLLFNFPSHKIARVEQISLLLSGHIRFYNCFFVLEIDKGFNTDFDAIFLSSEDAAHRWQ